MLVDAARHGAAIDKLLSESLKDVEKPVLIAAPLHIKNILVPKLQNTTVYGDDVFTTHYGCDLGTNEFMDCKTVVMIGNHYLPKSALAGRHLQSRSKTVTDESLVEINDRGSQRQSKSDSMESYFRQYIPRGACRRIDSSGMAAPMTAVVVWPQFSVMVAERSFPGCKVIQAETRTEQYKKRAASRKDSLASRLLTALADYEGEAATLADLEIDAKNFGRTKTRLINEPEILSKIGWSFLPGQRGKNPHTFQRL